MSQEDRTAYDLFLDWVLRLLIGVGTALVVYWLAFHYVTNQQKQDGMTLSTYQNITTGTSESDFLSLAGSYCDKNTEIADPNYPTVGYACRGKGDVGANADFTFQSGVLTMKIQVGLTD